MVKSTKEKTRITIKLSADEIKLIEQEAKEQETNPSSYCANIISKCHKLIKPEGFLKEQVDESIREASRTIKEQEFQKTEKQILEAVSQAKEKQKTKDENHYNEKMNTLQTQANDNAVEKYLLGALHDINVMHNDAWNSKEDVYRKFSENFRSRQSIT